jgi:hypothetical protein
MNDEIKDTLFKLTNLIATEKGVKLAPFPPRALSEEEQAEVAKLNQAWGLVLKAHYILASDKPLSANLAQRWGVKPPRTPRGLSEEA